MFAGWLEPLGPFEPAPRLAVAVSGGADSMALALLARDWAAGRGGSTLALVVDHGLRADAAAEAARTRARLDQAGIASRKLTLRGLHPGPAMAERARAARAAALEQACRAEGIVHLLLGHHAGDQAETVMMRLLRGSGADGLAAMPALRETPWLRLLRPLLQAAPGALRATLREAGVAWEDDPSNRDPRALRTRLRAALADPDGTGPYVRAHGARAEAQGRARQARERADAAWLGRHARLHTEGFAVLLALPEQAPPLRALLRCVSGASHGPAPRAVAAWLRAPRAATLGGVVLRPAGRLARGGWLLAREPAAMATAGATGLSDESLWDGRLRPLRPGSAAAGAEAGTEVGAEVGAEAAPSPLPALVRRGLAGFAGTPCWWPGEPLAGAGFLASGPGPGPGPGPG